MSKEIKELRDEVNENLSEDAYSRFKDQIKGASLAGKVILLEGVAKVIKI